MSWVVLGAILAVTSPSRVGLAVASCDGALEARLVSELGLEGYTPVPVEPEAARLEAELLRIVVQCDDVEHHAFARVEDYVTEKRVERTLPFDAADPRAVSTAALKVVELVHASLAEARYTAKAEELPEGARRRLEAPAPSSRWRVNVGFAVVGTTDVVGAQPGFQLGVARVLDPFELSVEATFATYGTRILGSGGAANVNLGILRGTAALPLNVGPVVLRPELGAGLFAALASGDANPTYEAQTGFAASPAVSAGLALSWPASPWVDVRASVALGVSLPPLTLRFPDSPDRRFGQPFVFASLGVSLH